MKTSVGLRLRHSPSRDPRDAPLYDELFRVLSLLCPSLFKIVYGCVHSGKFWQITREDGLGDNTNLQLCAHKRLTNRMLIKATVEQDPFFGNNNWVVNLFEKDATTPFDVHMWIDVPMGLQCNCGDEVKTVKDEDLQAVVMHAKNELGALLENPATKADLQTVEETKEESTLPLMRDVRDEHYTMSRDEFGNTDLWFHVQPTKSNLELYIKHYLKDDNALVFHNLDEKIASSIGTVPHLQYLGVAGSHNASETQSCHVVYGKNAPYPKMFFGSIFSAFVCCIVKHKGEEYLLTVDSSALKPETTQSCLKYSTGGTCPLADICRYAHPSKQRFVLPGGTAESDEIGNLPNTMINYRNIAIRTMFECTGVRVDAHELQLLASTTTRARLFGIVGIPENGQIFVYRTDSSNPDIAPMFAQKNSICDPPANFYLRKMQDKAAIGILLQVPPCCLPADSRMIGRPLTSSDIERMALSGNDKRVSHLALLCAQVVLRSMPFRSNVELDLDLFPFALESLSFVFEPNNQTKQILVCQDLETLLSSVRQGEYLKALDLPLCKLLLDGKTKRALSYCERHGLDLDWLKEKDVMGFGPLHYAVVGKCVAFVHEFKDKLDWQQKSCHGLMPYHMMLCHNRCCGISAIDIHLQEMFHALTADQTLGSLFHPALDSDSVIKKPVELFAQEGYTLSKLIMNFDGKFKKAASSLDIDPNEDIPDPDTWGFEMKTGTSPREFGADLKFGFRGIDGSRSFDLDHLVWIVASFDERKAIIDKQRMSGNFNHSVTFQGFFVLLNGVPIDLNRAQFSVRKPVYPTPA